MLSDAVLAYQKLRNVLTALPAGFIVGPASSDTRLLEPLPV